MKAIKREKEKWDKYIGLIEDRMKGLPAGKLSCRTSHNTDQYFVDRSYASKKDIELITGICEREYYEKILPEIRSLSKKLDEILHAYETNSVDEIYEQLARGRKALLENAVYQTKIQNIYKFASSNIKDEEFNAAYPIDTDIYTNNGEQVRSKSEKIIADTFQYYGIPYKYEAPLELKRGKGIITIHPDFTAYSKSLSRIIYVEHLGMMSDEGYAANAMNKISTFESNDLLLGRDLLFFHETYEQPLNTKIVRKYIEEYFV